MSTRRARTSRARCSASVSPMPPQPTGDQVGALFAQGRGAFQLVLEAREPRHRDEGGRGEADLLAAIGLDGVTRREPAVARDLPAVDRHFRRRIERRGEEPGIEALGRDVGRDPARDRNQRRGIEANPRLLVRLAHRSDARALLHRPARPTISRVDLASREDRDAHLPLVARVALEQQHFEAARAVAQDDDGARGLRRVAHSAAGSSPSSTVAAMRSSRARESHHESWSCLARRK